jgi:hypothetical protein
MYYREHWIVEDGRRTPEGELVLYEIYCLQNTPPVDQEEQAQCFQKRNTCWRTGELLSRMPPVPGMPKTKARSASR